MSPCRKGRDRVPGGCTYWEQEGKDCCSIKRIASYRHGESRFMSPSKVQERGMRRVQVTADKRRCFRPGTRGRQEVCRQAIRVYLSLLLIPAE